MINVFSFVLVTYLFGTRNIGSNVAIALAYDGWILATPNCIHDPVSIVIVHHMEVSKSAPIKNFKKNLQGHLISFGPLIRVGWAPHTRYRRERKKKKKQWLFPLTWAFSAQGVFQSDWMQLWLAWLYHSKPYHLRSSASPTCTTTTIHITSPAKPIT